MSNAICLLVVLKQQQVLRRGKGSATSRPSGSAPSLADLAGPWDDPAEDSREEIAPDAAPLYDAEPIVGGSSVERTRIRVVFPAPLGPRRSAISPALKRRVTPLNARCRP